MSVATVSYVLNDRPVSSERKQKVLQAIDELDYVPNENARRLRAKQASTIALVLPDITNPFYPDLAKGCQDVAQEHGLTLIMLNAEDEDDALSATVNQVRKGGVDGVILANATGKDVDTINTLRGSSTPVVLAHRTIKGLDIDSVTASDFRGAYAATEHLVSMGHKKVVLIEGASESTVSMSRKEGFERAMKDRELSVKPEWFIKGGAEYGASYRHTLKLLGQSDDHSDMPTAIFATSDLMALGALRAAQDMRLSVPDGIAIIGYDDLFLAATLQLTTVHVPRYEIGRQAMRRLIEKMHKGAKTNDAQHTVLDTKLVVRNTCGARAGTDR